MPLPDQWRAELAEIPPVVLPPVYGRPSVVLKSIGMEQDVVVAHYSVAQGMVPGRDGRGLDFDFIVRTTKYGGQKFELSFEPGAESLEQLTKWTGVAFYALSILPKPQHTLPIYL